MLKVSIVRTDAQGHERSASRRCLAGNVRSVTHTCWMSTTIAGSVSTPSKTRYSRCCRSTSLTIGPRYEPFSARTILSPKKMLRICLWTSSKRTKIERFTSGYPTTTPNGETRRSTKRYTMPATRMIQVTADARHRTVREYEPLDFINAQEREELKAFQGVFKQNSSGTLTASNYVGVITTRAWHRGRDPPEN